MPRPPGRVFEKGSSNHLLNVALFCWGPLFPSAGLIFLFSLHFQLIKVNVLLADIRHFQHQFKLHPITALRAAGEAVAGKQTDGPDEPVRFVVHKVHSALRDDFIRTIPAAHALALGVGRLASNTC